MPVMSGNEFIPVAGEEQQTVPFVFFSGHGDESMLTYKLSSGDLVDREVVLEVPSRGQGEVVLSGKSFEWKTTQFKSFERGGKMIFVAIFETEFRGMKSKTILRGTYLKGNNKLY